MLGRKKEEELSVQLCEGISLSESFFEQKENRILTLILKGFIVYLITMGGIGFYLSALNIRFNALLCHIVILVMALLCAMLYYSLLVENLGYAIVFILFAGMVYIFKDYINSGFYAIVNITIRNASEYLGTTVERLYNEKISDRYVTVTFVALFIGIVMDILFNVNISRRMKYVDTFLTVMFFNVIPLYIIMEPKLIYTLMLLTGMGMALVLKSGRHYNMLMQTKKHDTLYEIKRKKSVKKRELSYVYDIKTLLGASGVAAVFVFIVVVAVSVIRPIESFNVGYKENEYKELTMAGVSILMTDGLEGFYRGRGKDGGLKSGKLGDVSQITPDHQTDILMQFTPYEPTGVYLKGFTGRKYLPYRNEWSGGADVYYNSYDPSEVPTPEADILEKAFEEGHETAGKGTMRLMYVDDYLNIAYLPYYYKGELKKESGFYDISYFPRLSGNLTKVPASAYPDGKPYTEDDLYVPPENAEVIKNFIEEAGLTNATTAKLVNGVRDYFQENIPYTVKPGKTPKDKDFVNYFLAENRKGYCAHFASAATLIFRYMGLPARYIEGYAVGPDEVFEGEIVEDKSYADYYQGYSAYGDTALVEVSVTDDDAHAWVEVFDARYGWVVVDVTPSSGEAEDVNDFWSEFDRLTNGGGDEDENDGAAAFGISDKTVKTVVYGLLILLLVVICGAFLSVLAAMIAYRIKYVRAAPSDRLVMYITAKRKRLAGKDKSLKELINYRDLIAALSERAGTETDKSLIALFERAGFSDKGISEEEFNTAVRGFDELVKAYRQKSA